MTRRAKKEKKKEGKGSERAVSRYCLIYSIRTAHSSYVCLLICSQSEIARYHALCYRRKTDVLSDLFLPFFQHSLTRGMARRCKQHIHIKREISSFARVISKATGSCRWSTCPCDAPNNSKHSYTHTKKKRPKQSFFFFFLAFRIDVFYHSLSCFGRNRGRQTWSLLLFLMSVNLVPNC